MGVGGCGWVFVSGYDVEGCSAIMNVGYLGGNR